MMIGWPQKDFKTSVEFILHQMSQKLFADKFLWYFWQKMPKSFLKFLNCGMRDLRGRNYFFLENYEEVSLWAKLKFLRSGYA